MNDKIYFTKIEVHEGDDLVGGRMRTAQDVSTSKARVRASAVIGLQVLGEGVVFDYPRAARLWVTGAEMYVTVADYQDFEAQFGAPVQTCSRGMVILNPDQVVMEVDEGERVRCVLPCRMRDAEFFKVTA